MGLLMDMPSSVDLENVFGARGVAATTESQVEAMRAEERRGRLMRDAKLAENCIVQAQYTASFSDGSDTTRPSEWIDFGRIKFVERPALLSGSFRLPQEGESELNAEAGNYDPTTHLTVPALAMGLKWRQDSQGLYIGAKVVSYALGMVPAGYKVLVSVAFVGPAVRMG